MPGDIQFHSNNSYFGKNLTNMVSNAQVSEAKVMDEKEDESHVLKACCSMIYLFRSLGR